MIIIDLAMRAKPAWRAIANDLNEQAPDPRGIDWPGGEDDDPSFQEEYRSDAFLVTNDEMFFGGSLHLDPDTIKKIIGGASQLIFSAAIDLNGEARMSNSSHNSAIIALG